MPISIAFPVMDIERVIKKIRDIREAAPTNSSGANGFTNAAGTGPVAGYDKRLFGVTDDLLDLLNDKKQPLLSKVVKTL